MSLQGRPADGSRARTSPVDLDRLMSPRYKGGRPRKHENSRVAHAEAQRAYRRRKSGTNGGQIPPLDVN